MQYYPFPEDVANLINSTYCQIKPNMCTSRKDPIAVIDHYQKKCDALRRPAYDIKENYKWHTVSKDTFIFSAYFDNRTSTDSVIIWGTSGGKIIIAHGSLPIALAMVNMKKIKWSVNARELFVLSQNVTEIGEFVLIF